MMKILIASIGILKKSPEKDLMNSYLKRFEGSIQIKEMDVKKKLPPSVLKKQEGTLLMSCVPPGAYLVALDEKGKEFSSNELAEYLRILQVQGHSQIIFAIGGANGLAQDVKARANLTLSLGRLTWPHLLARIMLVEQLYRGQQIIKGHPYHRD